MIKILLTFILLFIFNSHASDGRNQSLTELTQYISSNDRKTSHLAMKRFVKKHEWLIYGEDSISIIILALRSSDSTLKMLALEALLKMGLRHNKYIAKKQQDLKPHLMVTMKDKDLDVAIGSIEIFPHIYSSNKKTEELLYARFNDFTEYQHHKKIIRAIMINGIESKKVQNALLNLIKQQNNSYKELLGLALLKSSLPASTVLPIIFDIIESPAFFANTHLIAGLYDYKVKVKTYLPRLKQIKNRIIEEQKLPLSKRTLRITRASTDSNNQYTFTIQKVAELISYLETLN